MTEGERVVTGQLTRKTMSLVYSAHLESLVSVCVCLQVFLNSELSDE